MSPILVRPVREQLEHDRVIRLLQAKYKRKFEVGINPGNEQAVPVGSGPSAAWYPDLVLQERGRKLAGVVEVETAESVNNLEAMSQWATFSKWRAQFHLYVPAVSIDSTRRLCTDLGISVAELWAYHSIGDQLRFTLVQKSPTPIPKGAVAAEVRTPTGRAASNGGPVVAPAPRPVAVERPPVRAEKPAPKAVVTARAAAPASKKAKPAVVARKSAPTTKAAPKTVPKAVPTRKTAAKAARVPAKASRAAKTVKAPTKAGKKKTPAAGRPAKRR